MNNLFYQGVRNALICTSVFLVACGTTSTAVTPDNLSQPQSSLSRPDGQVRVDTDSEKVAQLWAAAERARSESKSDIALELLYEALDIDPSNSLLWSRAAEIQLDQVEPALAENFAARSNSHAADNRPLLHRNWLIIERARSMRGDLLGVRSANKQVEIYEER